MQFHRARKNNPLDVASHGGKFLGRLRMCHAHHVLLDDGTLIEVSGDVVSGRTNELDPTLVSLVVGLGALEPWQERVVDIDHASREGAAQIVRQHLHVARENHKVDLVRIDELE